MEGQVDDDGYVGASTLGPTSKYPEDNQEELYERAFLYQQVIQSSDSLISPASSTDSACNTCLTPGYTELENVHQINDVNTISSSPHAAAPIVDDGYVQFELNLNNNNNNNNDNNNVMRSNKTSSSSQSHDDEPHTWNSEFQRLCEEPRVDSVHHWAHLAALAHDFVDSARHYAAIIVSELHLPPEKRTVPESAVGGTAGGRKYVAGGILFKFAADPNLARENETCKKYLYSGGETPNLEAAGKALGQELKGLAGYYWSGVQGLSFPLMAVIDFMGFRLLAVCMLPITRDTLCYGSDSGGRLANSRDHQLNQLMERAARSLNLAGHYVGRTQTLIYGPGDIEGHRGLDNRYYVLDFGRVYPPEAPSTGSPPGAIFYQLLRPELVRTARVPLCSDAFSGFAKFDPRQREFCEHVKAATSVLYVSVIPQFAQYLGEVGYEIEFVGGDSPVAEFCKRIKLVVELHRAGINVRHLGRIRFISTCPLVRTVLLSECVYRVVKNILRGQMRALLQDLRLPRASPFQGLLCDMYNRLLSNDESMWEVQIGVRLKEKFGNRVLQGQDISAARHEKLRKTNALSTTTSSEPSKKVVEQVDIGYILHKLNNYFGGISEAQLNVILHERDPQVILNDFGTFNPSVKHLGLVHFASGKALSIQGMQKHLESLSSKHEVARALRCLKDAREALSMVLHTSPDSVATLILLARIDLFPVDFYAERGDLHLVETCLRRAFENLKLAKTYSKSMGEPSALLVVAASKYMQYCERKFNADMLELYSQSLTEALKADPDSLNEFFSQTLRERNANGRRLLLSEAGSRSRFTTGWYCNRCNKQIEVQQAGIQMRHHCIVCHDYDLCYRCFAMRDEFHDPTHAFQGFSFEQHCDLEDKSLIQRERNKVSVILSSRLRAASAPLTVLNVPDTSVSDFELSLLDLSNLTMLDVSGCRKMTSIPAQLAGLKTLNVSNCSRLSKGSSSVLFKMPVLEELRAEGLVGEWSETSEELSSLQQLKFLNWRRRTFFERFCIWSVSLERCHLTNASHVGGYVVAESLRHFECQGAELISSVLVTTELLPYEKFCDLRRSFSGPLLLNNKDEEDMDGSGSLLAQFLRKTHAKSNLALKQPSKDAFLHIHSRNLTELLLNAASGVETLEIQSDTLRVLNLFRIPRFRVKAWSTPVLTTLYLSEWTVAEAEISELIQTRLPRNSLKNIFLCEIPNFTQNLLDQLLSTQQTLVYLNLYRSGPKMSSISLNGAPALKELSLEDCSWIRGFSCGDCPKLERVILTGTSLAQRPSVENCGALRQVFVPRKELEDETIFTKVIPAQTWPFSSAVEHGVMDYTSPKK